MTEEEFETFKTETKEAWEKFSTGVWNNTLNFYNHVRNTLAKVGKEGWRPVFCWSSSLVVTAALCISFVVLPLREVELSKVYYDALLTALALIIAALGLRSVDKAVERHQTNLPGGGLTNVHGGD